MDVEQGVARIERVVTLIEALADAAGRHDGDTTSHMPCLADDLGDLAAGARTGERADVAARFSWVFETRTRLAVTAELRQLADQFDASAKRMYRIADSQPNGDANLALTNVAIGHEHARDRLLTRAKDLEAAEPEAEELREQQASLWRLAEAQRSNARRRREMATLEEIMRRQGVAARERMEAEHG